VERFVPLAHDRGLCHAEGIAAADVVLVCLEDGDRAEALVSMNKTVIAIDLNPLSRTARTVHLPIIDEVTRAIPRITEEYTRLDRTRSEELIKGMDAKQFLNEAVTTIRKRLEDVLD
jgi:4-phosphopantoate--beta-alanine ligase